MVAAAERKQVYSFWQVQSAGWLGFYILLLLAALPRLGERDIFRYNTAACVILFGASCALRPVCVRAATRMMGWTRLATEATLFAVCLPLGSLASFATGLGTFGWQRLSVSNAQISWLQCTFALFLWIHLYMSMRTGESRTEGFLDQLRFDSSATQPKAVRTTKQNQTSEATNCFLIRTGPRIEVVRETSVLWFSAAGDYVELHTATGTHLLRETMRKLEASLDPEVFVRIHRSRIVRWAHVVELSALDNGEYRVRLKDGSVHRSSRTYAPRLTEWLNANRLPQIP